MLLLDPPCLSRVESGVSLVGSLVHSGTLRAELLSGSVL